MGDRHPKFHETRDNLGRPTGVVLDETLARLNREYFLLVIEPGDLAHLWRVWRRDPDALRDGVLCRIRTPRGLSG